MACVCVAMVSPHGLCVCSYGQSSWSVCVAMVGPHGLCVCSYGQSSWPVCNCGQSSELTIIGFARCHQEPASPQGWLKAPIHVST